MYDSDEYDDDDDDDEYDMGGGLGSAYAAATPNHVSTPASASGSTQATTAASGAASTPDAWDDVGDEWSADVKMKLASAGAGASDAGTKTFGTDCKEDNQDKNSGPKKPVIYNKTGLEKIPFVIYYDAKALGKWLHAAWHEEKDPSWRRRIYPELAEAFEKCGNPYWLALYLCAHAFDFFQFRLPGASLSHEILKHFKSWLDKGAVDILRMKHLNKDLQLHALELTIAQKSASIAQMMAEIFYLIRIKQDAIERVNELCRDKYYKEACFIARFLKLYDEFTIHDFLVPLLLQDREPVFGEYLKEAKSKQEPFLLLVDEWIGTGNSYTEASTYAKKHNVDNLNISKMDLKPLTKMIKRLSAKYGVTCPNVNKVHSGSTLRFLMYRRYEEANSNMNDAGFDELIDSTAGDDPNLCEEALSQLIRFGDFDSAARFAIRKSMPMDKIPVNIQRIMSQLDRSICFVEPPIVEENWETGEIRVIQAAGTNTSSVQDEDNKDAEKSENSSCSTTDGEIESKKPCLNGTYKFPNGVNVHFCDSAKTIDSFLAQIKGLGPRGPRKLVSGFDAEWKPVMPSRPGVALLQIGFMNEIYLLDIHTLNGMTDRKEAKLVELCNEYFKNPGIIKLGFSTHTDLSNLSKTCPEWVDMKQKLRCLVDLQQLARALLRHYGSFYPHFEFKGSAANSVLNSLADLVQACFGTVLDKTEQFTDWERRPLRQEQIVYAATDAFVLLDIYNFMERRCGELQMNFESFVTRAVKMADDAAQEPKSKAKPPPVYGRGRGRGTPPSYSCPGGPSANKN